jgi:hypothetical protein
MNDWRPDWTDETQYPSPDQHGSDALSNEEWAWEFLRRNTDYQRDAERTKIAFTEENNDPELDIYYCDHELQKTIEKEEVERLQRKYFLNHRLYPDGEFMYLMLPPHVGRSKTGSGGQGIERLWQNKTELLQGMFIDKNYPAIVTDPGPVYVENTLPRVTVTFDVGYPIETQIEALESILTEKKEEMDQEDAELNLVFEGVRNHKTRYVRYLRLLDGQQALGITGSSGEKEKFDRLGECIDGSKYDAKYSSDRSNLKKSLQMAKLLTQRPYRMLRPLVKEKK